MIPSVIINTLTLADEDALFNSGIPFPREFYYDGR